MTIIKLLQDFQSAFTAVITLVGILTLWNTTRLWHLVNRPVVIAFIDVNYAGKGLTTYDLFVRNIGNLTAVDIRLSANKKDILSCINSEYKQYLAHENFDKTFWSGILDCFSEKSQIAMLSCQETTKGAFGSTSGNPESNLWIYQASFPIKILYRDLSGRNYRTNLSLVIQQRNMFSNLKWEET